MLLFSPSKLCFLRTLIFVYVRLCREKRVFAIERHPIFIMLMQWKIFQTFPHLITYTCMYCRIILIHFFNYPYTIQPFQIDAVSASEYR